MQAGTVATRRAIEMSSVLGAIGVFALGGVGWFLTSFFARPLMRFVELRGDVIYRMVLYDNLKAQFQEHPNGSIQQLDPLPEEDKKRLAEAQDVFRELGARMRAFAFNEPLSVRIVRMWYYPLEASTALIGVSNTIDKYGGNRAEQKEKLEKALDFRTTG